MSDVSSHPDAGSGGGGAATAMPGRADPGHHGPHLRVTRIAPRTGWAGLDLRELWRYRELLFFMAWRDIAVRYKQTVLGVAWVLLQPFVTMVVFTFVFNRVGGISVEGVPYPVFTFAGLLPWLLFATALERSSESLVREKGILTKVYFPRLIAPLASVGSALADFVVAFGLLVVLMLYYEITFTWRLLLVGPLAAYAVLAALSVGLWFAALNARYRDVRYILPFTVRTWMFVSPVAYPLAALTAKTPESLHWLFLLNPMTGVLEGFRWAVLGSTDVRAEIFVWNAALVVLLFVGGLFMFRRFERTFVDSI